MGRLTEDMTRLSGEIHSLHGARVALIKDLVRGAGDLRHAVAEIRSGFRNAHAEMARKAKDDRLAFVSGLKRTVAGLRREFAGDLAGAHRAWFGPAHAGRRAMELEERRRAEGEARARREEEERRAREEEERRRPEAEAEAREEEQEEAEEAEEPTTPTAGARRRRRKR